MRPPFAPPCRGHVLIILPFLLLTAFLLLQLALAELQLAQKKIRDQFTTDTAR